MQCLFDCKILGNVRKFERPKNDVLKAIYIALNVFLYLERSRSTSSLLEIISGTFTVLYSISGARHLA